jgi:hypothetical protein
MESPVFVKTLGWFFLCFVNINDSPSLLSLFTSTNLHNSSSFSILTELNIKAFTSSGINVTEMVSFVLEELPPI